MAMRFGGQYGVEMGNKNTPSVRVTLGFKNAMSILGSKGRCPRTLKNFLDNTFVKFIKDY